MDRKGEKTHLQYTVVNILQHKACVIFLPFYWAYIKLGFLEVNFPAYGLTVKKIIMKASAD